MYDNILWRYLERDLFWISIKTNLTVKMKKDTLVIFERLCKKRNWEYRLPTKAQARGNRILVICGPSGVGKTSSIDGVLGMNFLLNKIFNECGRPSVKLVYVPSSTTRPMREGEKNGFDFNFLPEEQFLSQMKNRDFLLYFSAYSYLYAIDGKDLKRRLLVSDPYTLFIYNLNALQIEKFKSKFKRQPKVIFFSIPSLQKLERRRNFKGLSKEEKELRKQSTKEEIRIGKTIADFKIIGRDIESSVRKVLLYSIEEIITPNAGISSRITRKILARIRKVIPKKKKKF